MPTPPRFIYFDLGNVLLHFDHGVACGQMSRVAGIPEQQVHRILFEEGLQRAYESGAISTREFFETFCQQASVRPDLDALKFAGSAMFELNADMVPLVALLRGAGYRLGILSNTCPAHWEYISDGRFRIIPEFFEPCVLSFRVGAMKPSPAIFRAAAEMAGLAPPEILFVDDRPENVAGAQQAQLDAVQYTSPQALAIELRRRGVEFNY